METTGEPTRKKLMVALIFQDMRYQQLIYGLEALGLVSEHQLDLCTLAGRLQGIPEGRISDTWMEVYLNFMRDASELVLDDRDALHALAEKCYEHLMACYNIEVMVKEDKAE